MGQCKNDVILEHIKNYSKHIDEFRSQANSQGIWLFISTLGCWSVNIPLVQIIAAFLLFCIFIFNSKQEMTDKRSFHKIEKDIENDIDSNLTGDTKKARLYDLGLVVEYRKSIIPVLKTSPIFIVCYIFYSISFLAFLSNLLPRMKLIFTF
ncbi:TPA: hypothetical protein L9A40_001548 [Klebsiella pneumoniae]|uniref:hypothetical protein n=1 Tax=Klebsiella pneumoniae TaxID=573 RepID=UPI000E34DF3B|nr:hypothetical protein [Klebsiella pneumoniae]HDS3996275.1 hypothetical protein [Klebsiella pneumoniae subsp. pneumoniae]MCH0727640.1 hypothetical protein [Klebsiella pneumoniae]QAX09065.1 hypothetical protein C2M21_03815 [Klebsiella pneumoniae]QJJ84303.1 hypothetical protein HJX32_03700 [Klebsiella pneumoniae]HBQ8430370.1 hypothetical protein [Klebsiella pneumoniae]